ncbi:MAG: hypothetical protein HY040_04515 [Planctomycetes bacterium]|nr:hypothetical protein [Planctomycetota bacterium]
MQDDQIVVLLRTLRRPSFFSRDRDFFKKSLCSDQYSIVYLDVRQLEVAPYVRRFLRHPEFKTWSSRKGAVARVTAMGVFVWRPRASRALSFTWVK